MFADILYRQLRWILLRKRIKDVSEKQIVQEDCKPYLFTTVYT